MTAFVWFALALFVIVDAIVIVFVIRRFRSGGLGAGLSGARMGQVLASVHTTVGDYLRTHYSGDRAHLPVALVGLLPRVRELLRSHGVEPRPEVVQALIERSAARHRIASAKEIREALRTIR